MAVLLCILQAFGQIAPFDNNGNKLTAVDPKGHTTSYTYDNLYRPLTNTVFYTAGSTAQYSQTTKAYDAVGNVTSSTDPLGNTTRVSYDALNRPLVTTNADLSTTQQFYTSTGLKWKTVDEKWFNQAGVMPTFSVKQIQAQLLGTQGHT